MHRTRATSIVIEFRETAQLSGRIKNLLIMRPSQEDKILNTFHVSGDRLHY